MLTHEDLWKAIDALAARHRLSPSGLARLAGLDPTTFNKSKRSLGNGRMRWPSTESLAKVLDATGATLSDFVNLVGPDSNLVAKQNTPLLPYSAACKRDRFDAWGRPRGDSWNWRRLPRTGDPDAFALEIDHNDFTPLYRPGDLLLLSPLAEPDDGARLLLRLTAGELILREVLAHGPQSLEVQSIPNTGQVTSLPRHSISWSARVLWTSQ